MKLVDALVKRQLPDQAIPHLEHAARLSATVIEPRFRLGQIVRTKGDDDDAATFFQSVLNIDLEGMDSPADRQASSWHCMERKC